MSSRFPFWILSLLLIGVTGTPTPSAGEPATGAVQGGEGDWKQVRQEDGIRVSRRSGPGQTRPSFRAWTEVEAGVLDVLVVLDDDARRCEWMSQCVESRRLQTRDPWNTVIYTRHAAPWPVADRDAVVTSAVRVAPDASWAAVRLDAVESGLMPPQQGVVRMPVLEGGYQLRALATNRTRVEYEITADLGGRVPSFVTRRVTEEMPFETLRGLREQVAQTRGRYQAQVARIRGSLPKVGAPPPGEE